MFANRDIGFKLVYPARQRLLGRPPKRVNAGSNRA
jgi:hypothetical protein